MVVGDIRALRITLILPTKVSDMITVEVADWYHNSGGVTLLVPTVLGEHLPSGTDRTQFTGVEIACDGGEVGERTAPVRTAALAAPVMSSTYVAGELADRVRQAERTIYKDLTGCGLCAAARPCDERDRAERLFAHYHLPPRRFPGRTRQPPSIDWDAPMIAGGAGTVAGQQRRR